MLKFKKETLNIKKRLVFTNLAAVIVPILAAALVGIMALAAFLFALNRRGVEFGDENFYNQKELVFKLVDECLDESDCVDKLNALSSFSKGGLRLEVYKDGQLFYERGDAFEGDATLESLAGGDKIFVSYNARQLYSAISVKKSGEYRVNIFSTAVKASYKEYKVAAAIITLLAFAAAVISIILLNRFSLKFTFKKIEAPINLLSDAAKELSNGNLSHRIGYYESDEFTPVIYEFNHMAEKLEEYTGLIKEEDEYRNAMIISVAHDIKSPLTSIIGAVEALRDGVAATNEKRLKYQNLIVKKCNEVSHVVSSVSELMRVGEKELFADEKAAVKTETERFIEEFKEDYSRKGLEILLNADGLSDSFKINLTAKQYSLILKNIADNSLKFKKQGAAGKLIITLGEDLNVYKIEFKDFGVGVNVSDLPHIFEPFYRGDKARDTLGGNGMGLAVVKKLIAAAGGTVLAENNEAGGLSVKITFKKQNAKRFDC